MFYNPFKKSVKSKSGKITKRWYYWWVDPITGVQHQKVIPNVSNIAEAYAYVNSLPLPEKPGTQKPKIKDIAKEMFLPESDHVHRINQMGKKIAPRTITNNRHFVELVVEQFGENYLEDLTIPMVNGYLMTIEDKSGSWKNSFIEAVNSIYKEAPWHCNYTITKPEFPRFARNSKKADIFTTEELASFFDGANWSDGLREYLLFLTIAKCGLRLGEARALRVKQFVPDKNALVIDGFCERDGHRTNYNKKGSDEDQKLRVTLVPEDTMRVLMSYIRQHHLDQDDFVFQNDMGLPLRQEFLESVFKRVLIKAGIDINGRKLVPHSFRFTYVTRMRQRVDAETVQKMVGHSSVEMTEYYTRAAIPETIESIQDVMLAVNGLFD